jgi:hypothetical protein
MMVCKDCNKKGNADHAHFVHVPSDATEEEKKSICYHSIRRECRYGKTCVKIHPTVCNYDKNCTKKDEREHCLMFWHSDEEENADA